MKIVLATGIFFPEIGGPAILVKDLATELFKRGQQPLVLTYADKKNQEKLDFPVIRIYRSFRFWNYLKYFFIVLKNVSVSDKVVVFDTFSAALPVAAASLFKSFKFSVRLGGDFLWETAVNKFNKEVTLTDYYRTNFNVIEAVYFLLIRFIFRRAEKLITTTAYQQSIIEEHYGINADKFLMLPNAFPKVIISDENIELKKQLIFAGRFTKLKNLSRLISAFAKLQDINYQLLLIGEGPEENKLKQEVKELKLENRVIFKKPVFGQELDNLIGQSQWLILPSISDISPNIVFRSIALKTPVLMTKHSGVFDDWDKKLLFLKYPLNADELTAKLDYLLSLDSDHYASIKHAISKIDTSYGPEQLLERFLLLISSI
ncbi:MAG: glycosyltransferase family 4 protein [Patescibacteria group bacterium]|jgi:glycosyltransferase involved in cell wall biosynthesis